MPTVNALWSHQVAIIMGDYLYSRSITEITRLGEIEPIRVLADAANAMTVGEMRQLSSHDALDFGEDDYYRLIDSKTASLMAAACELGALTGAPEHRERLRTFGRELGLAFQIADDLLDYTADSEQTGKPSGLDLREHKVTLPLIAALPRLSAAERDDVEELFRAAEPTDEQIARVMELVGVHGGLDYARTPRWSARRARRRRWRGCRRARRSRRCGRASPTRWSGAVDGTAFASVGAGSEWCNRSRGSGRGEMNVVTRRRAGRLLLVVLMGMILGALLSELVVRFTPDSTARTFFTTSVSAAFGPLVVDLVAFGITLGPVVFRLDFMSVLGVLVVALAARTWL
jgi:hypothetical protein